MKIYCEDTLLYGEAFFSSLGQCQTFSASTVTAEQIQDADVLVVRSTTEVNEQLIGQCQNLKFVGTATAGSNHFDKTYLQSRGIPMYNAAGCNAVAVVEYVLCAMLYLAKKRQFDLLEQRIGIVGVGNIGGRLNERLQAMGIRTALYDPPLQASGDKREFVNFDEIMKCDLITLHVPLVKEGEHPTYHMFDAARLAQLGEKQCFINACRGEVVDNHALLDVKRQGAEFGLVIDVWENEPDILFELVDYTDLATAHIAGHTIEGKAKGTSMVYQALCQQFGIEPSLTLDEFLPAIDNADLSYFEAEFTVPDALELVSKVYDIYQDNLDFRKRVKNADEFRLFRKQYGARREFQYFKVNAGNLCNSQAIYGLGFGS
ncbi:4-phosphoerythronate dehydrogenase [Paraneptunicella aestuarii]|uniref:4-phosphoerythronate dehydrogenase n=1 Tax=Paraneptunicella aestuarii TaxID=2831148 RepID=UPI001E5E5B1A|nr:4-phosphoerythronate dehydrogenase [Paraneptunicella aestuarii]UAA37489.1 4-phosphoerythronate dehydrogenase [Paraneptunicella aestuarii]